MSTSENRIVWMDLEMTGLNAAEDRILEVAVLVTDAELEIVAMGPDLVVHQSESALAAMDEWNTTHHRDSGLTQRVRESKVDEPQAEKSLLAFLQQHCDAGKAPLAGNSIHQDRRFISRYFPQLDAFLHYRLIDVSSVKELVRRWYPHIFSALPEKRETHRALDDIQESIAELRYYRERVFR